MRDKLIALVLVVIGVGFGAAADDPVYVGEAACRTCHDHGARQQWNTWYLSKHARAYAALALPESVEIARLSGIDVDPHQSPVCLGCHTTAFDSEAWQRDDAFRFEDGLQCERCHGPGSEYMDASIMKDPEAARKAGLRTPDSTVCMVCHKTKGSHVAALEVRKFDFEWAMAEIAHPGRGGPSPTASDPVAPALPGPRYVGAIACSECHQNDGYVFSKWRLSAHANALATLGTAAARKIASAEGLTGDPRHAPTCLGCHTTGYGEPVGRFAQSFDIARGVQCESCHGPGSDYLPAAVMLDPVAARQAGLRQVTRATCVACHTPGIHGSDFDFERMMPMVDHSRSDVAKAAVAEVPYKTPSNVILNHDGSRLYVACEASDSLIVVDTAAGRVVAEVTVGNQPHGVCVAPDDTMVYVSNRGSDTVSAVDSRNLEVVATIDVGDEPHGLVTDADGRRLFVANAGSHDVSVVDLDEVREVKRLAAARGTWDVARSPDGHRIYVSNNLSHYVAFRAPSVSEVTVIDASRAVVMDRVMVPGANLLQGVDVAPDGAYALVTLLRTKNLVPMTRVVQGWVITNGLGILWPDGRVDQLLLDELDEYFADPTDVVITADGRRAVVSGGGIDAVAIVDLERMIDIVKTASDTERNNVLPNHRGIPTEYVIKRVHVGRSPRGVTASADGRWAYVADALDDTVSVVDMTRGERVAVIDLGGPEHIGLVRNGERIFHSAGVTFGRQFSCHSCHPDGGVDGITYDIEPDGIGLNPVDNRSLKGVLDTAPFKWTGKNPTLARQCGPRLAVFFTRIDPFAPDQVKALERYICTIPRNPNRFRVGDELTPAQRRGKEVFQRSVTNTGHEIPVGKRCSTCHPPPYYTNRELAFVGEGSWLDTHDVFDVPHLTNIYETSPYLHDGRADTLEEIWTRFNPRDEHGVTNDMTKDQLNDLVEFLKTL